MAFSLKGVSRNGLSAAGAEMNSDHEIALLERLLRVLRDQGAHPLSAMLRELDQGGAWRRWARGVRQGGDLFLELLKYGDNGACGLRFVRVCRGLGVR